MLNDNLIKVLSKIYRHENAVRDFEKEIYLYEKPENLSTRHSELLNESEFDLNIIKEHKHDLVVKELKNVIESADLEYIVSNLFIKSIASGLKRGIQPIYSYYFAKNMPTHDFNPYYKTGYKTDYLCKVCGLHKETWINESRSLYNAYIGYCSLGSSRDALIDLKEVMNFDNVVASSSEINIFLEVIDLINDSHKGETPSGLINRISKSKCMPRSNHTSRVWTVKCLAELGVLVNKYKSDYSIMEPFITYDQKFEWELDIHKNSPSRADVEFPVSAWRGGLGVNSSMVEKIVAKANKL